MFFKLVLLFGTVGFATAADPPGCDKLTSFVSSISDNMCTISDGCTKGTCSATIIGPIEGVTTGNTPLLAIDADYDLDLCNSNGATLSLSFSASTAFWTAGSTGCKTAGWTVSGSTCTYSKSFVAGQPDVYFAVPSLSAGDPTGATAKAAVYVRIQGFSVNAEKVSIKQVGITGGVTLAGDVTYGSEMCTDYNNQLSADSKYKITKCPVPIPILEDMEISLSGAPGSSGCSVTQFASSNAAFNNGGNGGTSGSDSGGSSGMSGGAVAGVVIGVLAVAGAIGFVAYRKKMNAGNAAADSTTTEVKNPAESNNL